MDQSAEGQSDDGHARPLDGVGSEQHPDDERDGEPGTACRYADAGAALATPASRRLSRGLYRYGAVPTSVFPPAVRAALNVVDVFELNFGPYSRFWPL
jgi:hypothetical protein